MMLYIYVHTFTQTYLGTYVHTYIYIYSALAHVLISITGVAKAISKLLGRDEILRKGRPARFSCWDPMYRYRLLHMITHGYPMVRIYRTFILWNLLMLFFWLLSLHVSKKLCAFPEMHFCSQKKHVRLVQKKGGVYSAFKDRELLPLEVDPGS